MRPKAYRNPKSISGDNLANWNPKKDSGGGAVKGVIIGPESSVGTVASRPEVDQGNDKKLEKI